MMRAPQILACIAILLLAGLYAGGILGSSRARVERDHSIRLPASVSSVRCTPFISLKWLWDSGEQATFSIPQDDLEEIIRQFRDIKPATDSRALRGVSRDGNMAVISTTPQPAGKILVNLETTWN
jgi:hypothetical protein